MAYLDSAGNVDPTQVANVDQWVRFFASFDAMRTTVGNNSSTLMKPAANLPAGAEKAIHGHGG